MGHDSKTQIEEKFLDSGDLFVLKYNDGYIFFEVEMWEDLGYKPYDNVGSVGTQTNAGFNRLDDPNGDDIVYIDETDTKVLHGSIGVSPSSVRMYTNYPEGENRLRTFPNLSVPSSRNGNNYGFIDGNDSPFDEPSDSGEFMIPPGVHLDFDFYNPNQNEAVEPKLNIKVREYDVRTIDPMKNQNVVRRAMSPGSPIPIHPVGSNSNQTKTTGDIWDTEPLRESRINRIIEGN